MVGIGEELQHRHPVSPWKSKFDHGWPMSKDDTLIALITREV